MTDCNSDINQIVDLVQDKNSHFLAFVDCARVEVEWKTIKSLMELPGDLIFNFQTAIIGRMMGSAKKSQNWAEIQRLNTFFGGTSWLSLESREACLQEYMKNLSKFRNLMESIRIKSKRGQIPYIYDLIIATRITSGGSKWFEPVRHLKQKIKSCSGNDVRRIQDVLLGKSFDLPFFFKKTQPTLSNWQEKTSR